MAADLDAQGAQELLGERSRGDARRGLARARALQDVAHVGEPELLEARQVGVARPRQVRLLDLRVDGPGIHPLFPVRVVAVRDQDRDRAAERLSVPDPRPDLDRVALDLHPAATAVAELAARHVAVDPLPVEIEACGQALDDRDQARARAIPLLS